MTPMGSPSPFQALQQEKVQFLERVVQKVRLDHAALSGCGDGLERQGEAGAAESPAWPLVELVGKTNGIILA